MTVRTMTAPRAAPRLLPRSTAAVPSRLRSTIAALLLVPAACGDDGGGAGTGGTQTETGASGSGTDTGTASSSGTATAASGTGGNEEGAGGLLTFTYYEPDALDPNPALGLAGGLRTGGVTRVEDFFAVYALQLTFPSPPADPDTVEENEIPVPFDWGAPADWVAAGNAMKLEAGDVSALACLLRVDDDYPVYAAEKSDLLDPACTPDPAAFTPQTAYDLLVYGGDVFDDVRIEGGIVTPEHIEVSAPDLTVFDVPLDKTQDLSVTWTAGAGDRVVIRVWDQYGRMVTAHATDDGSFTIPAQNLATLADGPGYLTVAREMAATVTLPIGPLDVVTRTEIWGYVDLFEG